MAKAKPRESRDVTPSLVRRAGDWQKALSKLRVYARLFRDELDRARGIVGFPSQDDKPTEEDRLLDEFFKSSWALSEHMRKSYGVPQLLSRGFAPSGLERATVVEGSLQGLRDAEIARRLGRYDRDDREGGPAAAVKKIRLRAKEKHLKGKLRLARKSPWPRLMAATVFLERHVPKGEARAIKAGRLTELAKRQGIAPRTLQRARQQLGVVCRPRGFQRDWVVWRTR